MFSFPVILVNSLSILMISAVLALSVKRIKDTGAMQLAALSVFMLIWSIGSFGEMAASSLPFKIFWRNFTQVGVFGVPVATLMFAIAFTGILKKYTNKMGIVFGIFQTLSLLFIITDGLHHLARKSISIVSGTYFQTLAVESTLISQILISVNFVFMAAALGLFIVSLFLLPKSIRKQVVCIIIGMTICIAYALLKVSLDELFAGLVPISGIFALANVFMLFGIFKFDMLMLAPIARNEVFNIVGDGIVISAENGKIVDANPSAMKFFNIEVKDIIAENFQNIDHYIASSFPNWHEAMLYMRTERFNLTLGRNQNFYLCETYPIFNKHKAIGSISVLRDVTEQKKNTDLLKEKAENDGLTGAYNRITFIERVKNILTENDGEYSLLFIDIDHFKTINDTYGHIFGDHVLISMCEGMQAMLKDGDFMGRMGGEEFAVFQKAVDRTQTICFAEKLKNAMSDRCFYYKEKPVNITISMGVAIGKFSSFDELYHEADKNLYKAKESGRNCVIS